MTSEPEQPRIELFVCDCECHQREVFQTPAQWEYGYGPEAAQALCTDCMLTRMTTQKYVVRTWKARVRKYIRSQGELDEVSE